jgi:serine/threonine protein kinase
MKGCFPERVVRFWIAEVACGLAFLHERGIIHRDLKPDNIVLDASGHAHITDFNIATYYSPRRGHTTVCGTVAYMAPEILHPAHQGYQWQVDWWSLGVIAHELLWARRPFEGNNIEKITHRVLSDPITIPPCVNLTMRPISAEGCHAVFSVRVCGDFRFQSANNTCSYSTGTRGHVLDAEACQRVWKKFADTRGSLLSTGARYRRKRFLHLTCLTCAISALRCPYTL